MADITRGELASLGLRAQALADIQRANARVMREDEDAFANDPTRVARNRANNSRLKTAVKKAEEAIAGGNKAAAEAALHERW